MTNIYTDPCQWVLLDPPVGPTVDDLNQHNQLWILDIDGTRVAVIAFSSAGISPAAQSALDQVLASTQID